MKFSILCAYYQGSVNYETYLRGIDSCLNQTFKDYEILVYHDGPLLDKSLDFKVPIRETEIQYKDCGNSLRDLALKEAQGDYILMLNIDNVLYPNALEELSKEIDRECRLFDPNENPVDTNNIVIFPVLYRGWQWNSGYSYLLKDRPDLFYIMTGVPPAIGNIDSMQLVMKRSLWIEEGGMRYKDNPNGDGMMYGEFTKKYGYRIVGMPLGEHW